MPRDARDAESTGPWLSKAWFRVLASHKIHTFKLKMFSMRWKKRSTKPPSVQSPNLFLSEADERVDIFCGLAKEMMLPQNSNFSVHLHISKFSDIKISSGGIPSEFPSKLPLLHSRTCKSLPTFQDLITVVTFRSDPRTFPTPGTQEKTTLANPDLNLLEPAWTRNLQNPGAQWVNAFRTAPQPPVRENWQKIRKQNETFCKFRPWNGDATVEQFHLRRRSNIAWVTAMFLTKIVTMDLLSQKKLCKNRQVSSLGATWRCDNETAVEGSETWNPKFFEVKNLHQPILQLSRYQLQVAPNNFIEQTAGFPKQRWPHQLHGIAIPDSCLQRWGLMASLMPCFIDAYKMGPYARTNYK